MEREDLISVIVPVYNVAKYLDACIVSIQKQTYAHLEILLIDDGSVDESGSICDRYALKDKRIRVIHQKNAGLSAARNRGISVCKGEYIAFVDSDDFIDKNFVESMYKVMIESESDLVCMEAVIFYDGDEKKIYSYWNQIEDQKEQYTVYSSEQMLKIALYQKLSVTNAQLKLYRKKLFQNIQFPVGRYYEDLATTYLFILCSNQVAVINHRLYAYRFRQSSIMTSTFNDKCLDCVWVGKKLVNDMEVMAPQLRKAACCAAFRINRIVFPKISFCNRSQKNKVWIELSAYRKIVMLDKDAQSYERLLALTSYCGQFFFTGMIFLFGTARKIRIKMQLRKR
ncbi:MAG: glycosyltransferase [Lachnospiraceae bacterium]